MQLSKLGMAVLSTAMLVSACGTRTPNHVAPSIDAGNSCKVDADCGSTGDCRAGTCRPYEVCPADIQSNFASIRETVFNKNCAVNTTCHTSDGATSTTGLDLQTDPYTALLGTDGKGAPASNIDGSVKHLVRVVPGDPDHSLLIIKLTTKTSLDSNYGSGMPYDDPGSVCPPTVSAIRDWIQAGALNDGADAGQSSSPGADK